jgi:hypothetical protein
MPAVHCNLLSPVERMLSTDLHNLLICSPRESMSCVLQGCFTGGFTPLWLLEECRMSLERIARSGKPQALMAAGALAGLSGAFSACQVPCCTLLYKTVTDWTRNCSE